MTDEAWFWQQVAPETEWIYRQLERLGLRGEACERATRDVLVGAFGVVPPAGGGRSAGLRPALFAMLRARAAAVQGVAAVEALDERAPEDPRARLLALLRAAGEAERAAFVVFELEECFGDEAAAALGCGRCDLAGLRAGARVAVVELASAWSEQARTHEQGGRDR